MIRLPPRSTRTDTLFPYTTLFRSGKMVAVKIGTATVDYLKANVPNAKLKLFPNIDNAFLELATGRVDAVVHDTPNLQYFAKTGGQGRVKVVGSLKSGDFYGIAFPKRSEEHTSELQSLMRISYAVFCLKKTISTALIPLRHTREVQVINKQ